MGVVLLHQGGQGACVCVGGDAAEEREDISHEYKSYLNLHFERSRCVVIGCFNTLVSFLGAQAS